DANAAHDAVEVAVERDAQVGDEVQGAHPRGLLAVLDAVLAADLADVLALAVPLRELPGQEDEITGAHVRDVVRAGRARLRKLDAEGSEAVVDEQHGASSLQPSVATSRALIVCMRFSAWSKTTDASDSKTSSATSRPSMPNFS